MESNRTLRNAEHPNGPPLLMQLWHTDILTLDEGTDIHDYKGVLESVSKHRKRNDHSGRFLLKIRSIANAKYDTLLAIEVPT